MTRVLVVDDEPAIRWLITRMLSSGGYEVAEANDGLAAVAALDWDPDLIILDYLLPGLDGYGVLEEVRRRGDTPVIMLTAMGAEADRVAGLDHGADDYLVKPFSIAELDARVRALLRRSTRHAAPEPESDPVPPSPVDIDKDAREVRVQGTPVSLTRREFDLLSFLADNPRRVVGTSELLEQVWQSSADWQDPNTVKEHIRRLRHKIEPDPAHPVMLRTVRGSGYLFEPESLSRPTSGAGTGSA